MKNMNKIVFSITTGLLLTISSCGDKMPEKPIPIEPAPQEVKVVKPETSVTYTGNFIALLDSICKTGAGKVTVTPRPYEVIVTRDSLGHKSIQSYSSQLGEGKKRSLNLDRICLPTDIVQVVSFLNGKWQYLKDASGKIYYIVIQLERGLERDSPYKIYASNWPVPLE